MSAVQYFVRLSMYSKKVNDTKTIADNRGCTKKRKTTKKSFYIYIESKVLAPKKIFDSFDYRISTKINEHKINLFFSLNLVLLSVCSFFIIFL